MSNNVPGAFPQEEPQPAERTSFNSRRLGRYVRKISEFFQVVVVKSLIFVLYVLATVLSKAFQVLYFRDEHPKAAAIDRASSFVRRLEDSLPAGGAVRLPPFFEGSYTQALYNATNKGVFLFVYLTNAENENSGAVFEQVVTNPKFVDLFADPNIMIWGGDLTNPECYQLANGLSATKFPFLGLLGLTRSTIMSPRGPVKTKPKMSLLVKLQGGLGRDADADGVIATKFVKKIAKYEPELKAIRAELKDKFVIQVLMKQQEMNFQSSLAKDRAKKLERDRQKLTKEYYAYRIGHFKQDLADTADKARVGIKLPSGERVTFTFDADAPVQDLFEYVQLYRDGWFERSVESTMSDQQAADKFRGFVPEFKFKVTSPLPPKETLNHMLGSAIRTVGCIYPNGMVIVEDE